MGNFGTLSARAADGLCALGTVESELASLVDFSAQNLNDARVRPMSRNPVFRLSFPNGRQYIVRLSTSGTDPLFERFATTFLNRIPGIRTPAVRVLETSERHLLLSYLRRVVPDFERLVTDSERHLSEQPRVEPNVSVANFVAGAEVGSDYILQHAGFRDPLSTMQVITPSVRRQICDAWAVYTVLGISDFHAENWLIRDGHVIPIDMAQLNYYFLSGDSSLSITGQHPFGMGSSQNEDFLQAMARSTSSELREFLNRVQREPALVSRIAQQSGFMLRSDALRGVVVRARRILELANAP